MDRTLSKRGTNPGELFNPSGIDCFKLGYDVFYCVCEIGCHRIQVISYLLYLFYLYFLFNLNSYFC
jgi:hypothetical protein